MVRQIDLFVEVSELNFYFDFNSIKYFVSSASDIKGLIFKSYIVPKHQRLKSLDF